MVLTHKHNLLLHTIPSDGWTNGPKIHDEYSRLQLLASGKPWHAYRFTNDDIQMLEHRVLAAHT